MSTVPAQSSRLHAASDGGDYRGHLYEARTLCHRTGWIAVGRGHVTCPRCLRKLADDRARALRKPSRARVRRWPRLLGRVAAAARRERDEGRAASAG